MRKTLMILGVISAISLSASAQCDSIANLCAKHVVASYISDGQSYRALLFNDQPAEFQATFYGGATYRIAGCSGFTDGNLLFSVYDKEHNLLFSNAEQKNAPYWDLKFGSTLDCTIEATLNSATLQSGCGVLVIGFKQ
jgi:hypothetical protein